MEVFVLTERKKGIVKTVFGWLFLALAFASFILTLMGALLLFLPGVLFAVIWYCFFLKANVVYSKYCRDPLCNYRCRS